MRIVIDTNVLISALLIPSSAPAQLLILWREGRFLLLTAKPQLEELSRVTRYPKIRQRLKPALAGRLLNELRDLAVTVNSLPSVDISPDPYDNYLLSIANGGQADYLITGDKRDLLSLQKYKSTCIISITEFLKQNRR